MNSSIIENLKEIVGEGSVILDEKILKRESIDYVGYRNWERFNGRYNAKTPLCLVKPQTTEQISRLLRYLNEQKIIAIPKTGGSCATGGLEVISENTVIIDASGMNKVIEFSEENMMVSAQCGVALEYLEDFLNKKGYTTGHFPQSLPMASLGGLVATRSIGQFSTLYGGIEDLLIGLEAVMPDGNIIRIKNVPRRSAGPDLRHLFIGNEGTLAFITEVTLKLFQYKPDDRWKMSYAVKDMNTGLDVIREIMAAGYKPAVVRLHDAYEAITDYSMFVEEGECILLFIAEGPKEINTVTGKAIDSICEKYKARPIGTKPIEIWLEHRNDLCNEMDDNKWLRAGVVAETCEISALWSDIKGIYEKVINRLKNEIDSLIYCCGHSSHSYVQGTNIYFKFAYSAQENDTLTEKVYFEILGIILEETLAVDGSMAHHHGIGKYRARWSEKEHGSSYEILKKLKDAYDPNGIMNLGTIFKY